jgi:hypothetical protein
MPAGNFNTFMFEQPAFDRYQSPLFVTRKTTQAVACHDSMTGHHDGHRIPPAGIPHRPGATPQTGRQITVTHRYSRFY